jgi:hypothetical protein
MLNGGVQTKEYPISYSTCIAELTNTHPRCHGCFTRASQE